MKTPKKHVIVERSRNHKRFVNAIMEAVARGEGIHIEEVQVLVAEIQDLRALLASDATK